MKKTLTIMAAMMTIVTSATAMPYETAREEALFLSDKMAYELDLTEEQYEAVYAINLDYLLNVNCQADVLGTPWIIRNRDLRLVLSDMQYNNYLSSGWFYRPVIWKSNGLTFSIYRRYNQGRLFLHRPAVFISYRGGHSHRDASFYDRLHFKRGNPPKIDGNRPRIIVTNRNTSSSNGINRNIGPNSTEVIVISSKKSHNMPTAAPNRTIGIHHHDKTDKDEWKGHDKDDHHRHFRRGHW